MSQGVDGSTNECFCHGLAIIWVIPWPADGTVKGYPSNIKKAIGKRLPTQDMYLIFDNATISAQRVLVEDQGQLVSVGSITCKLTAHF